MEIPQLLLSPLFISLVPTVNLTAPYLQATEEERRLMESKLPLYHQGSLNRRPRDIQTASQGLARFQQRKKTKILFEKQGQLEKEVQARQALI